MGRTYKVGPAGSFGPRYGTVVRKRYATLITELRSPHECPQCHVNAVKRLSVGIWNCGKCGYKFAGGAYSPSTKLGEIAERASRAGVSAALAAEVKLERAKAEEVRAKAAAKKRRRRSAEKKLPAKEAEPPAGDKSE